MPSLPGACKSGAFFAAARIASGSFFTIPCATANRGGCWPKSHLPESSSAWNWRRCRSPFSSEMKPTTKSEITPPMPIRTTMAITPIAHFNPVRPFTLSPQMNTDRTQITSLCNPVAACLWEARLESVKGVAHRATATVIGGQKFSVLARTSQSRLRHDRVRR